MVEQGGPLPGAVAYNQYPAPLAKYEDVVANRQLFMTTLEKLHALMGTKFMVPIIGGRDLDLHKLFLEVTSRGGIEKILREKKWKDVTATFNFPSTATNASYVLRKYYFSLLQHYEHIYYFKAQGWTPSPTGTSESANTTPVAVHGLAKLSPASVQQPSINPTEFILGAATTSVGSPVIGVIDGKFESGYLVTVTTGKEKLRGVLYQAPPAPTLNQVGQASGLSTGTANNRTATISGLHHHKRRKRRRKSEIKRRDPAHPKPNRSGYNFFFAEQHARLKPLHPGKDREISRMIGELWNKLKDDEKAVYQDKAIKDKERYRIEMENYRQRSRENQVISDAVPIQQRFPNLDDVDMVEVDVKDGRNSPHTTPEDESDSGISESEEDDDQIIDKDDENFSDALASPEDMATAVGTEEAAGGGAEDNVVGASESAAKGKGEFQVEELKADEKACQESSVAQVALAAVYHTPPPGHGEGVLPLP